jgi:hypothetical protein
MEDDWKAPEILHAHGSPKPRMCYVGLHEKEWGNCG